jgi:hypothetical protein
MSFLGRCIASSLCIVILSQTCFADELLFTVIRPEVAMNWKNPRRTLITYIKSGLNKKYKREGHTLKHSIGHVGIHVNCSATDGQSEYVRTTGQSNVTEDDYHELVLKRKVGLGVLLESVRGKLFSTEEADHDLADYSGSDRLAVIDYQISNSTCRRVQKFIEEYEQKKVYQNYGSFGARPRYGEGAGCSSFGVSVLEVAGLLDAEQYQDWQMKIKIPQKLVGGSLNPGNSVSIISVLFSKYMLAWAKPDEPGYDVTFWEPEFIYRWIQKKYEDDANLQKITEAGTIGVKIDATNVATPTDPLWLTSSVPNTAFASAEMNLSIDRSPPRP